MLKLQRPIIVFDLETTGLSISADRIIEIAYIKLFPDGTRVSKVQRVNPGIPIPAESTQIHGITDADVSGLPTFADVAGAIYADFEGADVCGFNSERFDLPMMAEELLRSGINADFSRANSIDVQNIFHKMEPRTLGAALSFYCHETLEEAHTAMADAEATLKVLEAQLEHYGDALPDDVESLAKMTQYANRVDPAGRMVYNEKGEEVLNFGKFSGQLVTDVLKREAGFYNWVMQGDFPQSTKQQLTKIKLRIGK